MQKRLLGLLITFICIASLAFHPVAFARGGDDSDSSEDESTSQVEDSEDETEDEDDDASEAEQKIQEKIREAQKQAKEKVREATKQAQERAREAAKGSSDDDSSDDDLTSEVEDETENEDESNDSSDDSSEVFATGVAPLQKIKDKIEQQKQRKLSCENRASGIQTKISNLATNAQRIQDAFSTLLSEATDLKNSENLSPANWDALLASAQSAKTTSSISVGALKALNTEIDCTNNSIATQIATIKAAADQAKTDLKAYRDSIKAVLEALEGSI